MKISWFQVIFAVLGACAAMPFLQDTPEVVAEKQRFFQLYNAAAAAAAAAPDVNTNEPQQAVFRSSPVQTTQTIVGWQGPPAATVPAGLPGSGNVENTLEVQSAIAEFQRAYNAAVVATTGVQPAVHSAPVVRAAAPIVAPRWNGPFAATVPAGLPGSANVADTPEVAAAKASFNAAFQQQLAFSG